MQRLTRHVSVIRMNRRRMTNRSLARLNVKFDTRLTMRLIYMKLCPFFEAREEENCDERVCLCFECMSIRTSELRILL